MSHTGTCRVEMHRNFRHANTLVLDRNRRMQIGQRFLVIEPSELGHKTLDQPKHAISVWLDVPEEIGA